MKICIINHSDSRGGASVASYRLMRALRRCGQDVRMLVVEKLTDDPCVEQVGTALSRRLCFLANTAVNWVGNSLSRRNLFKIDSARYGHALWREPDVRDADVIVVEWVNQGMLSVAGLRRLASLGKPVVCVMHDMWAMTGICHHAGACERYHDGCGRCPMLAGPKRRADMSRSTWQRKMDALGRCRPVFVAVSTWLADCARKSSLLRDADVRVIANPFPSGDFRPSEQPSADTPIIIMAAARLDDPIKRLPLAVEALNKVHARNPAAKALLVGALRDAHALDGLEMPYTYAGPVADAAEMARLYAQAAVVLSTSDSESFGYTLLEGQSAGCLPVAAGRGGQSDIIDSPEAGILLPEADAEQLADAICEALAHPRSRQALHALARRFDDENTARKFIELFEEFVKNTN